MKKIVLLVASVLTLGSCNYLNTQKVECAEVLDKERVVKSSGKSVSTYYLVYTDKGEFTITDEIFRANFSSSTWYGSLKRGSKYTFKTGGYRIGILSKYPNIHTQPTLCKVDSSSTHH